MLNMRKTTQQAEIDSACELIDFWQFNCDLPPMPLPEPTSPPTTRRISLHRSTYIFLLVVIVVLILTGVCGRFVAGPDILSDGKYGPHFGTKEHCEHGWPFVFLCRDAIVLPSRPSLFVWRLSSWRLWEGVERLDLRAALLDLVCALAVMLVLAALFETWRRRHRSIWQLHLGDLLLLMTMIARTAGYLTGQRAQYQRELAILQTIENIESPGLRWGGPIEERVEWQRVGPGWLRTVLRRSQVRLFDRVVSIDISPEQILEPVRSRIPRRRLGAHAAS